MSRSFGLRESCTCACSALSPEARRRPGPHESHKRGRACLLGTLKPICETSRRVSNTSMTFSAVWTSTRIATTQDKICRGATTANSGRGYDSTWGSRRTKICRTRVEGLLQHGKHHPTRLSQSRRHDDLAHGQEGAAGSKGCRAARIDSACGRSLIARR